MASGVGQGPTVASLARRLAAAGCVAAEEEAAELIAAADDEAVLETLVERRVGGEPLAWVTGSVRFCGEEVGVSPGVYVPRWQSEPLAEEAARRLPDRGVAVDVCTGSGAIAKVLGARRPRARIVGTEIDPLAASCARRNGVAVVLTDLLAGLGSSPARVDVVVGVVPYVPTGELRFLARDAYEHEPRHALDGGVDGLAYLRRLVPAAARLLRPGGSLLVELGGEEADGLAAVLSRHRFAAPALVRDEDGDLRGLVVRLAGA